MERFFGFLARDIRKTTHAATVIAVLGFSSQLLGLVRDRLFAHYFGATATLDLYYAAFRIPDFLFASIASLVSLSVVIPFFISHREEGKEKAKEFLDALFSYFLYGIGVISIVLFFLAPTILSWIFPVLMEQSGGELVLLSRILLLSPIFLGLSNLFGSVTQSERRFLLYAVSPVLYNIGIIAGVLILYPSIGSVGLAVGVVIGAFLHMIIQVPFLRGVGYLPKFTFTPSFKTVRSVLTLSVPRTLSLSSAELAEFGLVSFAALLAAGSVSKFNLAWNLQSVFLSLIGVSYSLAVFPRLVEEFTRGDKTAYVNTLSGVFRHVIFLTIPTAFFGILFREEIVSILLSSGAFVSAQSSTALVFACFIASLPAQCISLVSLRAHYARGITKAPLVVSIIMAVITLIGGWYAVHIGEIFALALSFSIASYIGAILHLVIIARMNKGVLHYPARTFLYSFLATIPSVFVAYEISRLLLGNSFFENVIRFGVAGGSGVLLWVLLSYLLDQHEYREILQPVLGKIKGKFSK